MRLKGTKNRAPRKEAIDRKVTCEKCGLVFMAMRPTRRFCTKKCADLFRYKSRDRKNKGKFISCAYCSLDVWTIPYHFDRKERFCNQKHYIAWQKKNSFNFPCVICGQKVFVCKSQIKARNRKTCSRECYSKLSRQRAEERRKRYTKHQLDRLARYSPEAERWREEIFERDNYTCQECGKRGSYLEADHIKPWAYFPNLRFDLSNGRTLCRPCHDKTKIGSKKMKELYASL